MSDGLPAMDRGLLRRLDWARPGEKLFEQGALDGSETGSHGQSFDISALLDAIQATATSLSDMSDRIRDLEAHSEAFAASNNDLEQDNRRLTIELGDMIQQRDALAADVNAEAQRHERLEEAIARHAAKADVLERDLTATCVDLEKIVGAVAHHFGDRSEFVARHGVAVAE